MTLDDLADPKFHSLVMVARHLIEECCARGAASPGSSHGTNGALAPEQLARCGSG